MRPLLEEHARIELARGGFADRCVPISPMLLKLVDPSGVEPLTSGVQNRRSPI